MPHHIVQHGTHLRASTCLLILPLALLPPPPPPRSSPCIDGNPEYNPRERRCGQKGRSFRGATLFYRQTTSTPESPSVHARFPAPCQAVTWQVRIASCTFQRGHHVQHGECGREGKPARNRDVRLVVGAIRRTTLIAQESRPMRTATAYSPPSRSPSPLSSSSPLSLFCQ